MSDEQMSKFPALVGWNISWKDITNYNLLKYRNRGNVEGMHKELWKVKIF